jgi:hypothetical protein
MCHDPALPRQDLRDLAVGLTLPGLDNGMKHSPE